MFQPLADYWLTLTLETNRCLCGIFRYMKKKIDVLKRGGGGAGSLDFPQYKYPFSKLPISKVRGVDANQGWIYLREISFLHSLPGKKISYKMAPKNT
jgi:hypothetical protein